VKITFLVSTAGYWWDGNIHSAVPGGVVEIDDANAKAVAWARHSVASGAASLIEDVRAAKAPARQEPKASPDVAVKEARAPARPGKPAAAGPDR
jgi:hypothetical protein